jgi:hypothetical protein
MQRKKAEKVVEDINLATHEEDKKYGSSESLVLR